MTDPRTIEDLRWRFREAEHAEIGRITRHGHYAQLYLEDGCDLLSHFHIDEMRRGLKRLLQTHNERAALDCPPTAPVDLAGVARAVSSDAEGGD